MFEMQQPVQRDDEQQKAMVEGLFRHYAPAIFAFLLQQTSSREDAEDLLLEIFTTILDHRQLRQFSEEDQRQWLWRITRNKMIDAYRRSARRPAVSVEYMPNDLFADVEHEPEHALLHWEEYAQLHSKLQTLPPLQQLILKLRFVNGLRSPEIALLIGKSETAVRAMLSRTMNQLRTLYRESEQ
jgi:RNA polymerase sigma factor (sigma-70 family)